MTAVEGREPVEVAGRLENRRRKIVNEISQTRIATVSTENYERKIAKQKSQTSKISQMVNVSFQVEDRKNAADKKLVATDGIF